MTRGVVVCAVVCLVCCVILPVVAGDDDFPIEERLPCHKFSKCGKCKDQYHCVWCVTERLCMNQTDAGMLRNGTNPYHCLEGCMGRSCNEICEKPCTSEIFPCSRTVPGNIVLMIFYAAILMYGAKMIGDGSELLLEILNPGVIGGLVLPVLGAVPDAAIIVVSGALGSREEAQDQLSVGVGTLAGSTIMLLTIPFGFSLLIGRCTIVKGRQRDGECHGFHPWKQGISVAADVPINAWIMIVTSFAYFIVQGVAFAYLGDPKGNSAHKVERWFALAGFLVCAVFFVLYSAFQIFNVTAQQRRMDNAQKKLVQEQVVERMIKMLAESRERKEAEDMRKKEEEEKMLAGQTQEEIVQERQDASALKFGGMWKKKAHESALSKEVAAAEADEESPLVDKEVEAVDEAKAVVLEVKDEEEESEYADWSKKKIAFKATVLLTIGTALVAFFSDPMVDVISEFGKEIGVPSFYVSFVVTPFCSNASELISSLMFAAKKKEKNISLTFAQIYGACIMNNTLCLGIFCALVCFRKLAWTFSAEVLTIFISEVGIGLIGGTQRCLRTFWIAIVLLFYPASLIFVFLLEKFAKWT